ncbi:hypothetical protein ES706_02808 [subsurface metagenome]
MSTALIIIGFLALAVGVIVLIVNAVRKRPVKLWGIVAAAGLALLIIGSVIIPSPAEFAITSFTVAPKEVIPGEGVTVTASVENTGGAEGVYHAVLIVDGVETEAKSVTLAPGEGEIMSFRVAKNVPGIHKIELGQLADTFKVLKLLKPAEFKVSHLAIVPDIVKVGQKATVTISVKNTGEAQGTYIASLVVDGVAEQTKDITLAGGAIESVPFIISRDSCGNYSIKVGGLEDVLKVVQIERLDTGTFVVKELRGGKGKLTVENGLDLEALIILSGHGEPKIPLLAVYIRAKDSYSIKGIKDGVYILYFALGEDWDSCSEKFTAKTTYKRFEEEFDFVHYDYEVTLHPVIGGTAGTEPVGEDEFPGLG